MQDQGLVDSIAEIHNYDTIPITHTRSKDAPLDGIFCSPNIKGSLGGFFSFGALGGNHQGLWIDIPQILLYGYNPPTPSLVSA